MASKTRQPRAHRPPQQCPSLGTRSYQRADVTLRELGRVTLLRFADEGDEHISKRALCRVEGHRRGEAAALAAPGGEVDLFDRLDRLPGEQVAQSATGATTERGAERVHELSVATHGLGVDHQRGDQRQDLSHFFIGERQQGGRQQLGFGREARALEVAVGFARAG